MQAKVSKPPSSSFISLRAQWKEKSYFVDGIIIDDHQQPPVCVVLARNEAEWTRENAHLVTSIPSAIHICDESD